MRLKLRCQNKKSSLKLISSTDTSAELELIIGAASANGASATVVANHWSEGSHGAVDLAGELIRVTSEQKSNFHYLYDLHLSIEDKISTIAKEMYGAGSIELSPSVKAKLKHYYEQVSAGRTLPLSLSVADASRAFSGLQHAANLHGQNVELIDRRRVDQRRSDWLQTDR